MKMNLDLLCHASMLQILSESVAQLTAPSPNLQDRFRDVSARIKLTNQNAVFRWPTFAADVNFEEVVSEMPKYVYCHFDKNCRISSRISNFTFGWPMHSTPSSSQYCKFSTKLCTKNGGRRTSCCSLNYRRNLWTFA